MKNRRLLEDDIRKRHSSYDPKESTGADSRGELAKKELTASYVSRNKVQHREGFTVAAVATDFFTGEKRIFVVDITVEW